MSLLDANKYRDLTADEIIALAETRVYLIENAATGIWSWLEKGPRRADSLCTGTFSSKLGAADDAVCTLGLDD
jgi:hypothetical protein